MPRTASRADALTATKVHLWAGPPGGDGAGMTYAIRHLALAVALTAATLTVPATALAKGGTPSPAPAPVPAVQCDYSLDGPTADGDYVFSNRVNEAGCLSVIESGSTL